MFDRKPKEREWMSWLIVLAWAGMIIASIPLVRTMTTFVRSTWGKGAFVYGVTFVLIVVAGSGMVWLRRRGGLSITPLAWVVAITGTFVVLTFKLRTGTPEEAVHYLEYGFVSLLIFRAFSHRLGDCSIYIATVLAGLLVGLVDESVQWLVPGRYFDLRDIWLNVSAMALVQLAIITVVRPRRIAGWPGARGWAFVCRLGAVVALALGLCHLNTPGTVAAYAASVPVLSFLLASDDVMIEYGYLYDGPETGRFRSRFTRQQLREYNQTRSAEAAAAFADFGGGGRYQSFLQSYTTIRDPFFHEFGIHLFSRNINLQWARSASALAERQQRYSIARCENEILESFFLETLNASGFAWDNDTASEVARNDDPGMRRESLVSRHLITAYSRSTAWRCAFGAALLLFTLGELASRRMRT